MQASLTTNAAGALAVSGTTKKRMQAIKDDVKSALQRFNSIRTTVGSDKAIEAGYDSSDSLQQLNEMAKALEKLREDQSEVCEGLKKRGVALRQLRRAEIMASSASDEPESRREVAAEVIRSLIDEPSQLYRLLKAIDFTPDSDTQLTITRALATIRGCSIAEIVAWLGEPDLVTAKLTDQVKQLEQRLAKSQGEVGVLTRERNIAIADAEKARANAATASRSAADAAAAETATAQRIREAELTAQRARQDALKAREDLASREDQIQALRTGHDEELSRLRRAHDEEVRRLRQSHEQELGDLRRGREQEAETLRQTHVEEVQRLYSDLSMGRQEAQGHRRSHAEEIRRLQHERSTALQDAQSLRQSHNDAVQRLREELDGVQTQLSWAYQEREKEQSLAARLLDRARDAEERVSRLRADNSRLERRVSGLITDVHTRDEQIKLSETAHEAYRKGMDAMMVADEREVDGLYENIGELFLRGTELQRTLDDQVQHASTLLQQLSIGTESDIWRNVARRALANPAQAQPEPLHPQPWKILSSWSTDTSMVIRSDERSLQAQSLDTLAILKSGTMDITSLLSRLSSMLDQLANGSSIFVSVAEMLLDTFATVGSDTRLHLMRHVIIHQVAELLVGNDERQARVLEAVDPRARQLVSSLEAWDSGSITAFAEGCVENAGLVFMGLHREPRGVLVIDSNDRRLWWVDISRIERRFLSLALMPCTGEPILLPLDSEQRIKWAIAHT